MQKEKSGLQDVTKLATEATKLTNQHIELLGVRAQIICDSLNNLQGIFEQIRNVPSEQQIELERLKSIRLSWTLQVEKIQREYRTNVVKSASAGVAGAGAGAGVAVATLGPTAAMGFATTFGVASTGTAISTLSGAAATNAALAYLGGGALAAGGGGMVAGSSFLALAGPVGWTIAGIAFLGSGALYLKSRSDKNLLENIFIAIAKRDIKYLELSILELKERISRLEEETTLLQNAEYEVRTFGINYFEMTEQQKYSLGSYVNLMNSSTQLLVNPIRGLQPKFTADDFNLFYQSDDFTLDKVKTLGNKEVLINLANMLYSITLNKKDQILLWKALRGNADFLSSVQMGKDQFTQEYLQIAVEAADFKERMNRATEF